MSRMSAILRAVFGLAILGGCATALHGTTVELVVESTPPGAEVEIDPGGYRVVTPARVVLPRKQRHALRFELAGYAPRVEFVYPQDHPATAGNLLAGGIIGMDADLNSGAAYTLFPNPVHVWLEKIEDVDSRPSKGARLVIFNTSTPALPAKAPIAIWVDDRLAGTIVYAEVLELYLEPGTHRLRLQHRDMRVFEDEYDLEVAHGLSMIEVFWRSFSTKFGKLDAPPDYVDWPGDGG